MSSCLGKCSIESLQGWSATITSDLVSNNYDYNNTIELNQGFHIRKLTRATKNLRDQSGTRESKLSDDTK